MISFNRKTPNNIYLPNKNKCNSDVDIKSIKEIIEVNNDSRFIFKNTVDSHAIYGVFFQQKKLRRLIRCLNNDKIPIKDSQELNEWLFLEPPKIDELEKQPLEILSKKYFAYINNSGVSTLPEIKFNKEKESLSPGVNTNAINVLIEQLELVKKWDQYIGKNKDKIDLISNLKCKYGDCNIMLQEKISQSVYKNLDSVSDVENVIKMLCYMIIIKGVSNLGQAIDFLNDYNAKSISSLIDHFNLINEYNFNSYGNRYFNFNNSSLDKTDFSILIINHFFRTTSKLAAEFFILNNSQITFSWGSYLNNKLTPIALELKTIYDKPWKSKEFRDGWSHEPITFSEIRHIIRHPELFDGKVSKIHVIDEEKKIFKISDSLTSDSWRSFNLG